MKNKSTQLAVEFAEHVDEFTHEDVFARQSILFFRDNQIMTDNDINNIILASYVASKKIKYVTAEVDKKNNSVELYVHLNKFWFLFSSFKKLRNSIYQQFTHCVPEFIDININVRLYKEYEQEKTKKD